jgi:hypothetical protein
MQKLEGEEKTNDSLKGFVHAFIITLFVNFDIHIISGLYPSYVEVCYIYGYFIVLYLFLESVIGPKLYSFEQHYNSYWIHLNNLIVIVLD